MVRDVTLQVSSGEVLVIFGVNGAGKSTTLRTIAGLVTAMSGTVTLDGADITKNGTHVRACHGLVLVPEGRRVFATLSVEENLRIGGYTVSKKDRTAGVERAYDLFPILRERRHGQAGLLSGGEQQMLAIARGLMSNPRMMLLDEPSMGLAPTVVDVVMDSVRGIADDGVGIVMVEQDVEVALSIADHARVMVRGELREERNDGLGSQSVLQSLMGN
ncbi:ABC transporter ATP-binding protein [Dactylosporangium sp. NPDC005572]|uniref:ABC transporter ATP-binding protein n=1 Tax=Dactylosporangium sp. NPDC005572 TaxID=3156889 RepID=UPI0033B5C39B